MLQNLQKFAEFQKNQVDNLVDLNKCCKTRIYLQRSVPIQPKTSENERNLAENLPNFATTLRLAAGMGGPVRWAPGCDSTCRHGPGATTQHWLMAAGRFGDAPPQPGNFARGVHEKRRCIARGRANLTRLVLGCIEAKIWPRPSRERAPARLQVFGKSSEISATLSTSSPTVSKIFRRWAVQKLGVRVDLGKCYTLRILLQNLASTQPRTSPGKIASFREIFGNFGDAVDFVADRFEKFSTRGGAKAGGAGRSGQMLHVAYLLAKFGLYPDENEPRQVWQIFADFRH